MGLKFYVLDGAYEMAYMKLESVAGKIDKLETSNTELESRKLGSCFH